MTISASGACVESTALRSFKPKNRRKILCALSLLGGRGGCLPRSVSRLLRRNGDLPRTPSTPLDVSAHRIAAHRHLAARSHR